MYNDRPSTKRIVLTLVGLGVGLLVVFGLIVALSTALAPKTPTDSAPTEEPSASVVATPTAAAALVQASTPATLAGGAAPPVTSPAPASPKRSTAPAKSLTGQGRRHRRRSSGAWRCCARTDRSRRSREEAQGRHGRDGRANRQPREPCQPAGCAQAAARASRQRGERGDGANEPEREHPELQTCRHRQRRACGPLREAALRRERRTARWWGSPP